MTRKFIILMLIFLIIILLCVLFLFINSNKNIMQQGKILLTSPDFANNQNIPRQYSCDGVNINPTLIINNVPNGTKGMAIIVDDPDAFMGSWIHWLIWNIPANTSRISAGSAPLGSIEGINGFGNNKYEGPCPPKGTHRYLFKLFALDTPLNLDKNSKKADLENAMKGHVLDQTELTGLYSR